MSSSLKRRAKSTDKLSPFTATLLPTKADTTETPNFEGVSSVAPKYPSFKSAEAAHGVPLGCSATQAALNGINVLCGVGVLTTPYAVKEGGWLGLVLLFVFAIVSWYTGLLLRRCLDSQIGLETYPDIGQAAFGMNGRFLISIILYVELYACCVEFLILEGDNLSALFPSADISFNGFQLTGTEMFTIMTAIFVLPTVWLRNLSLLSYVSESNMANVLKKRDRLREPSTNAAANTSISTEFLTHCRVSGTPQLALWGAEEERSIDSTRQSWLLSQLFSTLT
ncbi:hypothetical protein L7F22_016768 [Adiantum nelumboides]|nr:hypothetical protein [Adiantum nelumboides]